MEYNLEEFGLSEAELEALSDLVVDGALYVRLSDRKIVATVNRSTIKKKSLLLSIKFTDDYLEKHVDETNHIGKLYYLCDPIAFLLLEPS